MSPISWITDVKPEWPKTICESLRPELFLFDEEATFSGNFKQQLTDFQSSEQLERAAGGTGPNTCLRVQKQELTTVELIRIFADYLDRAVEDFCVVDYKGKRSIDIQWFSLEHLDPRALEKFQHEQVQVIRITRDEERLGPDDLRVNRFEIILRNITEDAEAKARRILGTFSQRGIPNWFSGLNFGARRNRHLLGWALVKRKWDWFIKELLSCVGPTDTAEVREARKLACQGSWAEALELFPADYVSERAVLESLKRYPENRERATAVIPEEYRNFQMHGLQAYAFNRFLEKRATSFDKLFEGDVAFMHNSSGCFPVGDPRDEQPRLQRFAISPTGPMFGEKFLGASGEIEQVEDAVLAELEIDYEDFHHSRYPVPGRRRPLRAPLTQIRAQMIDDGDLELGFCLPQGSDPVVVLEELMGKTLHYPGDEI